MADLVIDSFSKIYTSYFKKSYRFAKSYVLDDLVAEDIASESLIKLWDNIKKKSLTEDEILPYLLTILRNKSLDYLKHLDVERTAFDKMTDWQQADLNLRISSLESFEADNIYIKEMFLILKKSLQEMPDTTQKVFKLSRFKNKSNKEIAEEMGISVKGVEFHITKALKVLRVALKDYLPLFYFFLL